MLGFFRKYQKIIFSVVGGMLIVSFLFFGTFQTMAQEKEAADRKIGVLVDGSPLMEREFSSMQRLLKGGVEEGGRSPNLLSDSFIHREIILSGMGEVIALNFFDEIEEELQERWTRAQSYVPYKHPYSPIISATSMWERFAPEIPNILREIKQSGDRVTRENLSLLFSLYAAQSEFPPHVLHQMIYYQQSQNQGVQPDPALRETNMALFGFESVEEWFGHTFMDRTTKLLLNGVCIANTKGFTVSKEEARKSLFTNVYRGLKHYSQGQDVTSEQTHEMYKQQLRYLGLSESAAIALWQKVLAFHQMCSDVGDAVFFDSLAMNQFVQFAKPSIELCRYRLPTPLQFRDTWEMLKFQRYIEIVAADDYLGLPKELRDAAIVAKEHPELVGKSYLVEKKSVTLDEVAAAIPIKATWSWEMSAENFSQLQEEFAALAAVGGETEASRRKALDGLSPRARLQVDRFARICMIKENPHMVDERIAQAEARTETLELQKKRDEAFAKLLDRKDPTLAKYRADEKTYFAYNVLSSDEDWKIRPFEKVVADGTMEQLLDALLEEAYLSFEMETSLDEAKEEVAKRVYADIFGKIAQDAPEKLDAFQDYASHRFDAHIREMMLLVDQNLTAFLDAQQGPWPLVSETERVGASTAEGRVGTVVPEWGQGFYKILSMEETSASEEEIAMAKQHLANDAKCVFMEKLCGELEEAIH